MSDLDLFHFLRPGWLLLLPLALLLPWLWTRGQRPSGDWSRVCDAHLLRWLSVGREGKSRGKAGPLAAAAAMVLAILALAGPSWVKLPDASFTARDARVIALDLSASMLAEDLKPNRLTQARYRLADLLADAEEGQVGLVAFGGDAFVVSPLTSDMNTIANLLPALRPDIIPVAGSRADRALALAATLLERAGVGGGQVLLVTDSADSRAAAAARSLRDAGILTSVLAAGTAQGAPIPSGGGFLKDRGGNVVIARLEVAALQEVAAAGGGRYSVLGGARHAEVWADGDSLAFERRDQALEDRWQDSGPWLVLAVIPLLLVGFRRGLLFVMALGLLPAMAPVPAEAGWWDDLWQRNDQRAWTALQQNEPARAAALAEDPAIAAQAWYRSGEYERAAHHWRGLEHADAHYNLGNALALQGDFDGAIAAYEQALEFDPDMHDAIYNKNVIEQLRQKQQDQQQQGKGDPQQEPAGEEQTSDQSEQVEGEQQQGEQQGEGEQQNEMQARQQQEKGEAQRQLRELEETWSEEDAQAMEQWLRRIPDDPGGLLRRKFRNEYMRRGETDAEGESW